MAFDLDDADTVFVGKFPVCQILDDMADEDRPLHRHHAVNGAFVTT